MSIGRQTLRSAYKIICDKGATSRKELAELLNISEVSAGKTVSELTHAGIISEVRGELNGRSTVLFTANPQKNILLIDACRTNIAFALTSPAAKVDSIIKLPHLPLLDIDRNLTVAASDIVNFLHRRSVTPDVVAVAYAPVSPYPIKPLLSYALTERGINIDLLTSGSVAACEYCSSLCNDGEDFSFTQVNALMWGCISSCPEKMLEWSRVKVGNNHGESIGSVLSYDTDPNHLLIYFKRFFATVEGVVNTKRNFISSTFLPKDMLNTLCSEINVEDLSASLPIMNGLFSFAKDILFDKIFFGK